MTANFDDLDAQLGKALEGNKRFIEDLFMRDAASMREMLDQSVREGWRTSDEAEAEYADFMDNAHNIGNTAIQTSPNFYV